MVAIGIPTLRRYDLLVECLRSLTSFQRDITRIVVIDNGGEFERRIEHPCPIEVIRPGRNLGVAASWNLLRRMTADEELLLLNDDVRMAPDTLARVLEAEEPFVCVSGTPGFECRRSEPRAVVSDWSCFLQRKRVWDEVGPYDEMFWPAGHEDCDYWYRMGHAGYSVTRLAPRGMTHAVGASLNGLTQEELRRFEVGFARNQQYYAAKWGGNPGCERFSLAFNGRQSTGA